MKKILFLVLIKIPLLSFSQESNLGNWLIYLGNKKISSKWNWHNEVQYRNYNAIGDLEQLLLRTGLGYDLSDNNNNFLLGYGYILSENYIDGTNDKVSVNEHRIFQQFITRQNFNRLNIQHRYRFEQRWIEEIFKLRFRYFLSVNIPLNNAEMREKTVYLSAYNEIFLNSNNPVFDRNRLYGGFGYYFSGTIRMELGYMNQFLPQSNRDQINIIAFVNF